MAGRKVSSRVKGAKPKKISTQLFDYQIQIIEELSNRRANPIADIYRFALDYYIVAFKENIKSYGITVPEELQRLSEEKLKRLGLDRNLPR